MENKIQQNMRVKGRKRRKPLTSSRGDIIFDVINYILMVLLVIVTIYPFLNILAYSLNDAVDSLRGGITIFPRVFTLYNYEQLFQDSQIVQATFISVARTVIGSIVNVVCCIMVAYALSRREYVLRTFISRAFLLTMYFGGGLIPYFLLMKAVGLLGSFWIYIIPNLVSAWNILIMRSYISSSIPESLIESSRLDGASDFRILAQIIFPLSLPVIATVILWEGVGQWNSWFDVYIYNGNKRNLSTLQFELQKILQKTMMTTVRNKSISAMGNKASNTSTPQATRAAMTIVATLPILFAYPFLQKYFIHGLTLGGVKG